MHVNTLKKTAKETTKLYKTATATRNERRINSGKKRTKTSIHPRIHPQPATHLFIHSYIHIWDEISPEGEERTWKAELRHPMEQSTGEEGFSSSPLWGAIALACDRSTAQNLRSSPRAKGAQKQQLLVPTHYSRCHFLLLGILTCGFASWFVLQKISLSLLVSFSFWSFF